MKTIYKFPLRRVSEQYVDLPFDAKILSVQMQKSQICIWVELNADAIRYKQKIFVVGTGHKLPDGATNYIGTVQDEDLVWHIYTSKL